MGTYTERGKDGQAKTAGPGAACNAGQASQLVSIHADFAIVAQLRRLK